MPIRYIGVVLLCSARYAFSGISQLWAGNSTPRPVNSLCCCRSRQWRLSHLYARGLHIYTVSYSETTVSLVLLQSHCALAMMVKIAFFLAAGAAPILTTALPSHAHNNPVCIVGAGPSGLTIAHELEARSYSTVVFEKQPVVGGKCQAYYEQCVSS